MFITLTHGFDFFRAVQSYDRSLLHKAAYAGDGVLEQLVHRVLNFRRGRQISDSPPRHGNALRETVHSDDSVGYRRIGGHAYVRVTLEYDTLVYFVRYERDAGMAQHKLLQRVRLFLGKRLAGRVVRIVYDQYLRFIRDELFQLLKRDFVVLFERQAHRDRLRRRGFDDGRIRNPRWFQVHHFVAGVDERAHRQIDGELASGRYDNAVRRIIAAVFVGELLSYPFAQLRQPGAHGVVRVPRVDLTEQLVANLFRRVEIRLSTSEIYYAGIRSLHLLGLRHERHRARRLKPHYVVIECQHMQYSPFSAICWRR